MTRSQVEDVASALDILVDGFLDNPVMSWVFAEESSRARALDEWFRFWLDCYGERARVEVSPGRDGAAIWAPPGTPALTGPEIERLFGLIQSYEGDRAEAKLAKLATVQVPEGPHWYLNGIAARRGGRSRGVGAGLLEPFLALSDSEGVPIYLESSNPRNLSFYRRYGFEDCGPCVLLDEADARIQPMLRAPGASASAS
ncbi:MAG: GNAT family N-acetyltransferase [Myxococcota bacterium]|nr:GNAT family N-acetyltransferase [Myxococcota bacterium]